MKREHIDKCKCPFCEKELEMKCFQPMFCEPCHAELIRCAKCGKLHSSRTGVCPGCGK